MESNGVFSTTTFLMSLASSGATPNVSIAVYKEGICSTGNRTLGWIFRIVAASEFLLG